MDDASSVFDASILTGPIANYPVADSFNRDARARLLDRRHPARVRRRRWCGICRSARPRAAAATASLGALANDWTVTALVTLQSGVPVAVTQTTNFNAFAGFGVQRPNLVGDPDAARRRSGPRPTGSTRRRSPSRRSSRSAPRRAIPVRGPVVSRRRPRADAARVRVGGRRRHRAARGGVQPAEHAEPRRAQRRRSARRTSARSRPRSIRASSSSR